MAMTRTWGKHRMMGGGIDETRLGSPVRLVVNSFIDEALRMHSHSLAVQ